jgi:carbamoyl-phosphate synthase large subunit
LSAKSLSLSPQVLIEKSLKGWKELEYEVVRESPVWIPSGSKFCGRSWVSAVFLDPRQSKWSGSPHHMLRSAAIKIVRHVGVVGECNVQYALNPNKREYMVQCGFRAGQSSADEAG